MKLPTPGMVINGPDGPNSLELKEYLGSGAFGFVFKAISLNDGQMYAVKFPQIGAFAEDMEVQAFFNEVTAAQEVTHPNVVKVFFVELTSEAIPPYLVMEYIDGGTLASFLNELKSNNKHLQPVQIKEWSLALIDGMTAVNQTMLHRDLKPDNILIDNRELKITDFGLSKLIGAVTRSKTFKGGQHVLYMAPEGWRGEKNNIQIDMYSLGIILFEISTLEYPYQTPSFPWTSDQIRNMHLFQSPRRIETFRSDLPIGFCQVVTKMMEKNPDDRFSTWDKTRTSLVNSWADQGELRSTVINDLVNETGRIHEETSKRKLARQEEEEKAREERKADRYQLGKLLYSLCQAIHKYNLASTLGSMDVRFDWPSPRSRIDFTPGQFPDYSSLSEGELSYAESMIVSLPFGGSIRVDFFGIDPSLKIKKGNVRFAGIVVDPDGFGFNYLLAR